MQHDDPRAFRPHLTGAELFHAQERLLAALMQAPTLWQAAARSNIGAHHFHPSLRPIFHLATKKPQEIRDAVLSGTIPMSARIYNTQTRLAGGVVLQLARQIAESADRTILALAATSKRRIDRDEISFNFMQITSVVPGEVKTGTDQAPSETENTRNLRKPQNCASKPAENDLASQVKTNRSRCPDSNRVVNSLMRLGVITPIFVVMHTAVTPSPRSRRR